MAGGGGPRRTCCIEGILFLFPPLFINLFLSAVDPCHRDPGNGTHTLSQTFGPARHPERLFGIKMLASGRSRMCDCGAYATWSAPFNVSTVICPADREL